MINGNSSPTIVANRIVSNLVTRVVNPAVGGYSKGGGVYQMLESTATPYSVLINNLIADNKADDPEYTGRGGGICTCGGSFVLINNTIIRNLSLQNGTNNPAKQTRGQTITIHY